MDVTTNQIWHNCGISANHKQCITKYTTKFRCHSVVITTHVHNVTFDVLTKRKKKKPLIHSGISHIKCYSVTHYCFYALAIRFASDFVFRDNFCCYFCLHLNYWGWYSSQRFNIKQNYTCFIKRANGCILLCTVFVVWK